MAKTLEELIILKRTALRYLLMRESKLLALGKNPMNKKIANFVKNHHEDSVWSSFLDSMNEDLTRNINVFNLKLSPEEGYTVVPRSYRLGSVCRESFRSFKMNVRGGRMADSPIVKVEQGQLQGKLVNTPSGKIYYSFQGIPYAKPPLGSLRFKAPEPAEPWDGVRDATAEGNVSAQIDPLIHKEFIGDENCLFLNVYTPNLDGEFLPVMLFIHGGGYRFGSGNVSLYGPDFLVEKDVVVVTINYRCGALGFLSLNTPEVPGNAGLKDMIQAIRWVKDNIDRFGGNSGNLTLFGESAGGAAVSILTASPLTKDLISKVIIQSGTALNNWAFQKNPLESARSLAKSLGCESQSADDILEHLRATSIRDIVDANEKMSPLELFFEKGQNAFAPVVEKEFPGVEAALTENFIDLLTTGRVSKIPVMIGSTALEFTFGTPNDDLRLFIPEDFNVERNSEEAVQIAERIRQVYFKSGRVNMENLKEYYELLSDYLVNLDTYRYTKYLVQNTNSPVYLYKFDYVGELNLSKKLLESLGLNHAAHMDELGYLFNNKFQKEIEPTPQDIKMRERMVRLWTNFAKTGNPTPDENNFITITWLTVTKDNLYYIKLSNELSLETNPDQEKMELWDRLYNKYYKIWELKKPAEEVFSTNDNVETQNGSGIIEEETKEEELVQELGQQVENVIIVNEIVEAMETVVEADPITEEPELIVEEQVIVEIQKPTEVDPIAEEPELIVEEQEIVEIEKPAEVNGKVEEKEGGARVIRPSNEIKVVTHSNGAPKDVIRANDPPEDDLPKNIGINKFVNFFESLGKK